MENTYLEKALASINTDAKLSKFIQIKLERISPEYISMVNTTLKNTSMVKKEMENGDSDNSENINTELKRTQAIVSELVEIKIEKTTIENTEFENTDMENTEMQNTELENTDMQNIELENTESKGIESEETDTESEGTELMETDSEITKLIEAQSATELERKYPSIDFGEHYDSAKEEFLAFNKATIQLKFIDFNADYFISDYFLKLRNQVNLERELSKKQIDDYYDSLIKELSGLEDEYKNKKNEEKHEQIIKKYEKDLKKMNTDLNIPKFDLMKWNEIKSESISRTSELKMLCENYKNDLLMNQLLSIVSIQAELKNFLFREHIGIKKTLVRFLFSYLIFI